ncbi:hypothetical protein B0H13DRAFT_1880891 [Mycena leptocephala]|nr:hypothetical protein B0H13DRAFT_1880891 [Mycena leptocephala]
MADASNWRELLTSYWETEIIRTDNARYKRANAADQLPTHALRWTKLWLWPAAMQIRVQEPSAMSLDYKTYTLELVDMTALSKDGPALCKLFGDTIDRVQTKYNCYVIFFATDADGGSKKERIHQLRG